MRRAPLTAIETPHDAFLELGGVASLPVVSGTVLHSIDRVLVALIAFFCSKDQAYSRRHVMGDLDN